MSHTTTITDRDGNVLGYINHDSGWGGTATLRIKPETLEQVRVIRGEPMDNGGISIELPAEFLTQAATDYVTSNVRSAIDDALDALDL